MRLLWVVTFLAAVVVALFTVSNLDPVSIGFWPFDTRVELPLAVAVLAVAAVAFLFGAAITWLAAMGHRRRARRLGASVEALQAEVGVLQDRLKRAEASSGSAGTALAVH
ncbi:MAG: lipopolysaccharide assembly protein LapA domain-containing protein [Acetobacteraceae bacterium]